jgi:hypothetical protein
MWAKYISGSGIINGLVIVAPYKVEHSIQSLLEQQTGLNDFY